MANRRGFALVAVLVILALLGILSAAALQTTATEVQISARDRDGRAALYAVDAVLEEARYCSSLGWGILEPYATGRVRVASPPLPGLSWAGSRYVGFTLADGAGGRFPVVDHTAAANPVVVVDGGTPATGRFTVYRDGFAGVSDGTWLTVNDHGWALRSDPDAWKGWLCWNAAGRACRVLASSTAYPPGGVGQVLLKLGTDPGPGPYTLSLNPWLASLASGCGSPPGDADAPATPRRWNRILSTGSGPALGEGYVTARFAASGPYDGTYLLEAAARVGPCTRVASARVYRAGRADQSTRDWRCP